MECILQKNKSLDKVFLEGLKITGRELTLDEACLKCCNGTGLSWNDRHKGVFACDLKKHFRMAQKVIESFAKIWPENPDFPLSIEDAFKARYQKWFDVFKIKKTHRGFLVPRLHGAGPSPLWSMALSVSWRLGAYSHIVNMNKIQDHQLFPPERFSSHETTVVFIEGTDELWDGEKVYLLRNLLNWCEGACAPVWIEIARSELPAEKQKTTAKFQNYVNHRIAQIKNRPPLYWIGEFGVSKLLQLSFNVSEFTESKTEI